jgi:TRAP-type C4-dicarboxylate transport system substrate-binding protein
MNRRKFVAGMGVTTLAVGAGFPSILKAQAPITLNGAVQFNDDHVFNRALVKFEELTKQYYGKPINFILHKNSSLGLRSSISSTWRRAKPWTTASSRRPTCRPSPRRPPSSTRPFLFRDLDHWNKVPRRRPAEAGSPTRSPRRPR